MDNCINWNESIHRCVQRAPCSQIVYCQSAKKQIICIMTVSIIFNLPRFFECKVGEEPGGFTYPECPLIHNELFTYMYTFGCQIIGIFLFPFCMLLLFCVRIALSLHAARQQPINRHGVRPDTKMTSMLLLLLGIFLVCHACWGIFTI